MLKLVNVETRYGGIRALKGISLSVIPGEIVALIGSNGAGKSTTLMSISGITPVQSGQILFNDCPIEKTDPDKIVALGISQVPEGRHIFPKLSVLENLEMGAFLRNDHAEIKKDFAYIYELFPILRERRHQQGGTLSGGEQQMLAISRALMARPKLLLLDEPSLGLSPLMTKLIFSILTRINTEHGTTIFLVEQNAFMALKLSHRAYVLENGVISMEGKASDLLHNEDIKKAYLGI
ncbi:MAG TPA: ABC transporter ATP-binding protein [Smithellaceae bacterium]|jgi:branched-chain amino acid transport system ATP-binding protein|nr:ABC transporter ATP-binding protein [Smithellaceae bacterium]HQM44819.1 ABC transporter ATP-binding protein [Smithellaceae bacterium]